MCDNCYEMRRAFEELRFRYSKLVRAVEASAAELRSAAYPMAEELRGIADRERSGLEIKNPEIERIQNENVTLHTRIETLNLLLEASRGTKMTREESAAQRESFARGNVAIDRAPDSRRTLPGSPESGNTP